MGPGVHRVCQSYAHARSAPPPPRARSPLILLAQTRQAERDKAHAGADAKHREELAQRHNDLIEANTRLTEQIERLTEEIHRKVIA